MELDFPLPQLGRHSDCLIWLHHITLGPAISLKLTFVFVINVIITFVFVFVFVFVSWNWTSHCLNWDTFQIVWFDFITWHWVQLCLRNYQQSSGHIWLFMKCNLLLLLHVKIIFLQIFWVGIYIFMNGILSGFFLYPCPHSVRYNILRLCRSLNITDTFRNYCILWNISSGIQSHLSTNQVIVCPLSED